MIFLITLIDSCKKKCEGNSWIFALITKCMYMCSLLMGLVVIQCFGLKKKNHPTFGLIRGVYITDRVHTFCILYCRWCCSGSCACIEAKLGVPWLYLRKLNGRDRWKINELLFRRNDDSCDSNQILKLYHLCYGEIIVLLGTILRKLSP